MVDRRLTVRGYHRLPVRVRQEFDDWLEAEGIDKANVFEVSLTCAGIVTVGRYRRNTNGSRFFDHRLGRPADEYILVAVSSRPPPEAFGG